MTTELCTYTRNACDIARRTGVERIELCAAPLEGGTTPSAGLIRYARSLPGLRLSVMIRPRGGDFLYTLSLIHISEPRDGATSRMPSSA